MTRIIWSIVLCLLFFVSCGYSDVSKQVTVRQTALIMPPSPPVWSGDVQNLSATLGASTLTWTPDSNLELEGESSIYAVRTLLNTHIQIPLIKYLALWIPYSYGFGSKTIPIAQTWHDVPTAPSGGLPSLGLGLAGSININENTYISSSLEFKGDSVISSISSITCYDYGPCDSPSKSIETNSLISTRFTLLGGLRMKWARFFLGFTFTETASNRAYQRLSIVDDGTIQDDETIQANISLGHWYLVPTLGTQIDLGSHFGLITQVSWPIPLVQEIAYGPVVSIALSLHTIP